MTAFFTEGEWILVQCHLVKRYPVVPLVPTLPRWDLFKPGGGEVPKREHGNPVPWGTFA